MLNCRYTIFLCKWQYEIIWYPFFGLIVGHWTHDLTHPKQVAYQWATSNAQISCCFFSPRKLVSMSNIKQEGRQLEVTKLPSPESSLQTQPGTLEPSASPVLGLRMQSHSVLCGAGDHVQDCFICCVGVCVCHGLSEGIRRRFQELVVSSHVDSRDQLRSWGLAGSAVPCWRSQTLSNS